MVFHHLSLLFSRLLGARVEFFSEFLDLFIQCLSIFWVNFLSGVNESGRLAPDRSQLVTELLGHPVQPRIGGAPFSNRSPKLIVGFRD